MYNFKHLLIFGQKKLFDKNAKILCTNVLCLHDTMLFFSEMDFKSCLPPRLLW